VAAKMVNRNLTVIVTTGDGDCYGEGGNHFIHNIRRNADITVIVHNNQIYGLTKGQASPTTDIGHKTKVQTEGVILEPFQPIAAAITLGAGFVARGYSQELEHLAWLIAEGIKHKGFSLIDVLQPCISFNKINNYEWYSKRVYKVNDDARYNPQDKPSALAKAWEWADRIPIGIIYQAQTKTYEERSGLERKAPLVEEPIDDIQIAQIFKDFR
jgi:2-oxoglutarate ferredoxin oxidoreductase subunit beta